MPRTRSRFPRLVAAVIAACAILAAIPALAGAATTFTVDTTADAAPTPTACVGLPADCSLRQAVALANEAPGPDTIVLPAGHYTLTLKGDEEDGNLSGDLDVNGDGPISIQGDGARTTVIDANGLEDRVFDVLPANSLSLSRLTLTRGLAISQSGGGISVNEADLALDRVAVRANVATEEGSGGGIYLEEAEATISGSLIAENRNSGNGGGIRSSSSSLAIVNTTIANNAVDTSLFPGEFGWGAYGGGIEISGGNLALGNVTIAGNLVADKNGGDDGEGAGIYGEPKTAQIVNTIVSGNTWLNISPGEQNQCTETLPSEGHNIEEQPLPGQPRCFAGPTDAITNPLLGPLANNGGETDTMALLANSPAINAGLLARCPTVDQRGFPRPQLGGCDVGAFEAQPAPPPVAVLKPTIKRSGKVKVKKAGRTFWVWPGFKLSCPAGSQPCTGMIKARAPKSKGKAGSSAAKKVLIGKAKINLAPGRTKAALRLKLNRRGAKLLRELGKLRTQFEVVARVGTDPPVKAKKTARLKLPKGA